MKKILYTAAIIASMAFSACTKSNKDRDLSKAAGGTEDTGQKPVDEVLPEGFEKQTLLVGQEKLEVPKTSPEGGVLQSEPMLVSCVNSVNQGAESAKNGIILVKGSEAVLVRDLEFKFEESAAPKDMKPNVYFVCVENPEVPADSAADNESYEKKELKVGEKVMEVVKTSAKDAELRSVLTSISCGESPAEAAKSGYNGISLLKGSKLVVMRDLNYDFGDEKPAEELNPTVVISCN